MGAKAIRADVAVSASRLPAPAFIKMTADLLRGSASGTGRKWGLSWPG